MEFFSFAALKIHVSPFTQKLLAEHYPSFVLESRGEVDMKVHSLFCFYCAFFFFLFHNVIIQSKKSCFKCSCELSIAMDQNVPQLVIHLRKNAGQRDNTHRENIIRTFVNCSIISSVLYHLNT